MRVAGCGLRVAAWKAAQWTKTLNSQLSTFNSQLSTSNSQLSAFNFQLSTLNFQLSTLNFQLSTFSFQLSTFSFQLSTLNFQPLFCFFLTPRRWMGVQTAVVLRRKRKYPTLEQ
ncbi:MAG: hypothetical protein IJT75_01030 [Bacteroidaceae bacterium]|nr:hypothetical protein [Bacteroidaceae bacterium]